MTIAQFTDFHFDDFLAQKYRLDTPRNFLAMLGDAVGRGVDRLVLTGDFGASDRYPWLAEQLNATGLPFDVIGGNHDTGDEKHEAMRRAGLLGGTKRNGGEYYYSRDFAGRTAVFLDTSRGETSERQKRWLADKLRSSSGAVVFAHHPLLDCGTAMDASMALRDRDALTDILTAHGMPITIFCGHYHFTHETRRGNISQFVTPACVMQIRSEGSAIVSDSFDFGYRVIELSSAGLDTGTRMFASPRKVMPGE
jgi:Icc protein